MTFLKPIFFIQGLKFRVLLIGTLNFSLLILILKSLNLEL